MSAVRSLSSPAGVRSAHAAVYAEAEFGVSRAQSLAARRYALTGGRRALHGTVL